MIFASIFNFCRRSRLAIFCLAASAAARIVYAQGEVVAPTSPVTTIQASSPVSPLKTPLVVKTSTKPEWQDLTPAQRLSLRPLAQQWSALGEDNKRKWIAIAASYPTLGADEQAKMHSRMTEWVSLSPQQRTAARLNFAQSKELTPSHKSATWQAYQALSPEEKQKLAVSAPKKPAGAALAVKPIPPEKLTPVPVTRLTPKPSTGKPAVEPAVNRSTLLPQAPQPAVSASTPSSN